MCASAEPLLTAAVHAAAPHTRRCTYGSSWEGLTLPNPPAGGDVGQPGCPSPLCAGCALFNPFAGWGVGARASGPHLQGEGETWFPPSQPPPTGGRSPVPSPIGGPRPPKPSRRRGYGETRFPHAPARGRSPHPRAGWEVAARASGPHLQGEGETRFPPHPSARAYLCLTPFLPPVIMLIRYRQGLARPAVRGSCRRDLRVSLTQSTRRCRSVIGATRSPPRGDARMACGPPRTGRSLPVAAMRPGAIPPSPPPRAVSRGMRGAGLPSPLHRVDPVSERQACLWSGKMKTKESSH